MNEEISIVCTMREKKIKIKRYHVETKQNQENVDKEKRDKKDESWKSDENRNRDYFQLIEIDREKNIIVA